MQEGELNFWIVWKVWLVLEISEFCEFSDKYHICKINLSFCSIIFVNSRAEDIEISHDGVVLLQEKRNN